MLQASIPQKEDFVNGLESAVCAWDTVSGLRPLFERPWVDGTLIFGGIVLRAGIREREIDLAQARSR